jgi:hypothetical protein
MTLSALARFAQVEMLTPSVEEMGDAEKAGSINAEQLQGEISEQKTAELSAELEGDTIQADVEALAGESVALEAYVKLLTQASREGGMTAQEMAFVNVGLEAYQARTAQLVQVPSIEEFDGSVRRNRATRVSVEALSEHAKGTWEALKAALKAAWEAFLETVAGLFDNLDWTIKNAKQLKTSVHGLKGSPSDVAVTSPIYFIDGKYVGDDMSVTGELIDFLTQKWAGSVGRITHEFTQVVKDHKFEDLDMQQSIAALLRLMPQHGYLGTEVQDGDIGFRKDAHVTRSKTLPGNTAVYMAMPVEGKGEGMASFMSQWADVAFRIHAVPKAQGATAGDQATQSPQGLNKTLDDIIRMAEKLKGLKTATQNNKEELVKLASALDGLRDKANSRTDSADGKSAFIDTGSVVSQVTQVVNTLQRMNTTDFSGIVRYCTTLLKAQVLLVKKQVECYSGAPAAALAN